MTVTRHAKAFAQDLADRRRSAEKQEYRRKLLRLQTAYEPALTSKELAQGLEIESRDLGRFLSESPRLRHSRPDGPLRALIDAVLDGDLLIAAQEAMPGMPRSVLFCDERDVKLLASSFVVKNLSGGEVPERQVTQDEDWDESELWDLFETKEKAPGRSPVTVSRSVPAPTSAVAEPAVTETAAPGPLPERRRLIGRELSPIGFGAMRLSTGTNGKRLDRKDAVRLIRKAVESGVDFFDTADSYALDHSDIGHNERLLGEALGQELRGSVVVASKAGLIRPGGKWLPNGRPEHLRASCEAALKNLGVEALDLYQLHVVDPKVPLGDSVGELAKLREEGKIRHVGLCNVQIPQVEVASAVVPIASVQNAVSFFDKSALEKGLVAHCAQAGIPIIAHSPIGGHRGVARCDRQKMLKKVAERHGISARQVALAWLLHMGPGILPIPGAGRDESLESTLAVRDLRLDAEDWPALDRGRAWANEVRSRLWALGEKVGEPSGAEGSGGSQGAEGQSKGEVVLFVGPPAGGKTSRVEPFVEQGFCRLNRDELGGKLSGLVVRMAERVETGETRFVLDNTYPTRASREPVILLAKEHGFRVRCIWLDTPLPESLYNACRRMLQRQGRILSPAEILRMSKDDPNMLPPAAIFHYFRSFEEPRTDEGFDEVERVAFERRTTAEQTAKALILDYDGTLRRSTGPAPFPMNPDQVEILPGRKEVLDRYVADGWLLLGVSNQSAIGKRQMTDETAQACFARTNELLGHDIEVLYSPNPTHRSGVWDRKPMPGLGVQLIEEHGLDRNSCIMVGDLDSDRVFAENCGFEYRDQSEFFRV